MDLDQDFVRVDRASGVKTVFSMSMEGIPM